MQEEQNKRTVRRFVEEYQNAADETAFAEILAADVVDHSRPPGIAAGAEGMRQQFDGFRRRSRTSRPRSSTRSPRAISS